MVERNEKNEEGMVGAIEREVREGWSEDMRER